MNNILRTVSQYPLDTHGISHLGCTWDFAIQTNPALNIFSFLNGRESRENPETVIMLSLIVDLLNRCPLTAAKFRTDRLTQFETILKAPLVI